MTAHELSHNLVRFAVAPPVVTVPSQGSKLGPCADSPACVPSYPLTQTAADN